MIIYNSVYAKTQRHFPYSFMITFIVLNYVFDK